MTTETPSPDVPGLEPVSGLVKRLRQAAQILAKQPCEVYGLQQTCEAAAAALEASASQVAALEGELREAKADPSLDDTAIAEILDTIERAQKSIYGWAGTAFVAGEELPADGMSEEEHKGELYSELCRLGSTMQWLHERLSAGAAS